MENRKLLKKLTPTKKLILIVIMVLLLPVLIMGRYIFFYNLAITGQVIDVETKSPIEGAIVVGMWRLEEIPGQGFGGYAKVSVVTSGTEGKFKIPFWVRFKPWKFGTVMVDFEPEITIYKPGYKVYWSHKKLREGMKEYWNIYTPKQMEEIKEANSLNPAKLTRIYTDKERLKNYDDFTSNADFPGHHYSNKTSGLIFDALDAELSNISNKTEFDTKRLIISNKELRKFWAGGDNQ